MERGAHSAIPTASAIAHGSTQWVVRPSWTSIATSASSPISYSLDRGPVLTFTHQEWRAFLAGVHVGEFDLPAPCTP